MALNKAKWIDFGEDISTEKSFSGANNQSVAADVTGFLFSSSVRSFISHVSVTVDTAAENLYEVFEIRGVKKGLNWEISVSSSFDNSLVDFSITSGQLKYTSSNYAGFNSLTIKFRATTTTT